MSHGRSGCRLGLAGVQPILHGSGGLDAGPEGPAQGQVAGLLRTPISAAGCDKRAWPTTGPAQAAEEIPRLALRPLRGTVPGAWHRGLQERKLPSAGVRCDDRSRTGSVWRLHYSVNLPSLGCDFFKLTATEGRGTGESFKQSRLDTHALDCGRNCTSQLAEGT